MKKSKTIRKSGYVAPSMSLFALQNDCRIMVASGATYYQGSAGFYDETNTVNNGSY